MQACIVVLQGQPPGGQSPLARQVVRVAQEAQRSGAALHLCDGIDAASAAVQQALPACDALLVVIDPDVEQPFTPARRLVAEQPDLHFLFAVPPGRETALRQQATFGAPAGGHWMLARADDGSLAAMITAELAVSRQQRRLRTTLDRVKLRLTLPAPVDSNEYRRLVATDRYLASVLAHATDGIVSVDRLGRVVSSNPAAQALFAGRLATGHAQAATALGPLFDDPAAVQAAFDAALGGTPSQAEFAVTRGSIRLAVEVNVAPLTDDAGAVVGAVAILRDTTARHIAEDQLRSSIRQKDEFLAMLAHELRNPLTPIRTAADLLTALGQPNPRARRAVDIIARQVTHMTGLIDDLLDVARVTRGTVTLDRQMVDLRQVAGDAIEQARALLTARQHRITQTLGDVPPLLGDRKRLTQVLANLLINGARYTPPGGHIRLTMGTDSGQAVLTVSDDGTGMEADLVARVFDLFTQADRPPDRAEGGLGIGLALVKTLTELHGGTVSARSAGRGQGSTFEVRLPLPAPVVVAGGAPVDGGTSTTPPATTTTTATTAADGQQPLSLMVVDDNEDAAQALGFLLEEDGYAVQVEIDPRNALQAAQQRMPDVFILDIGMPHMDGHELARRIRALQAGAAPTLIALTGYGQAEDKARSISAGFDHHLVKPLDTAALEDLLQRRAAVRTR